MSEDNDPESKTEEATEKRLFDALEKGDVPISREVTLLASLSGIAIIILFILRPHAARLVDVLIHFIDDPAGWHLARAGDAQELFAAVGQACLNFLAPVLVLLMVLGITASAVQNPLQFIPSRLSPDFGRISPRAGMRRIFGARGWTEFGKNVVKVTLVATGCGIIIAGQKYTFLHSLVTDEALLPDNLLALSTKVVVVATLVILIIASADLTWSRILWKRDHRMSRNEVREELRQLEGDRFMKARLRSLRMDRSRKRMLAAVPKATMVVVNPTHYAVALRYLRSEGGAPLVIAKGVDLIALKIRAIAEEERIPIIEDKPLARSLYAAVTVDATIPPEFYRAVAEIVYLIQQKARAPSAGRRIIA